MKNLSLITILILIIFSCSDSNSTQQNVQKSPEKTPKSYNYSIPPQANIYENLAYGMCETVCLLEEFLPIGWSEDDKYFAWITQPENEVDEGFDLEVTIQNMNDNEKVWSWSFNERKLPDWDEISRYDIVKTWEEKKDTISQKLEEYAIVPLDESKRLKRFPAQVNKTSYAVTTERQKRNNVDYGHREIWQEKIFLNGEGLGSQSVYDTTYGEWGIMNSVAIGLIPSNNNKAALIKLNKNRGWAGPPHVISVEIIGCNLREGFNLQQ